MRRGCLLLAIAAIGCLPTSAAYRVPGRAVPEVLAVVDSDAGRHALALAPGGGLAVSRPLATGKSDRSEILVYDAARNERTRVTVPGRMRHLLFATDGRTLYGLQHLPAKRTDGDTFLLSLDVEAGRARRVGRMPPNCWSLEHWPERNSMLLACRDEVRTLVLPSLHSGPLFGISGDNLALVRLHDSLVVVGQGSELLLLDLDDRPGRYGLEPRARAAVPVPVRALAAPSAGGALLAELADGSVWAVDPDLQRLTPEEPAVVLRPPPDTPRLARDPPPAPATRVPAQTGEPRSVATAPQPKPLVPPTPTIRAPTGAATPVLTDEPTSTAPLAPSATEQPLSTLEAQPPPVTGPVDDPLPDGGVGGRVSGPAVADVIAVVAFGPDNVVREAARTAPTGDGSFRFEPLPPGRYRIGADGGGGRVLVTEPRFLVVDVTGDEPVSNLELRVLRAL